MIATALIKQMIATYAAATSYSDHGTVTTTVSGRHRAERTLSFDTAFVRGGRFRFEFRDGNEPYVLWSDGAHSYEYWPGIARIGRQVTTDFGPHVERAIAAATGISSGTAHTIPTMLMPQLGEGTYFLSLQNLHTDQTEDVDGHPCVRIAGNVQGRDVETLWIDRDSHLLRRIADEHRFTTFEAHDITKYEPSLNMPIAPGRLEPPDLVAHPAQPPKPIPTIGIVFALESARIEHLFDGGPAARAGLRVGDVVTAVDGKPVHFPVEGVVFQSKVGTRRMLTISRAGTTLDVPVMVEASQ